MKVNCKKLLGILDYSTSHFVRKVMKSSPLCEHYEMKGSLDECTTVKMEDRSGCLVSGSAKR